MTQKNVFTSLEQPSHIEKKNHNNIINTRLPIHTCASNTQRNVYKHINKVPVFFPVQSGYFTVI